MEPLFAINTTYWGLGIVGALVFAILSGWIAGRKGHSAVLWGILGFFFTIITLIIVLVLPRREA